MKKSIKYLILLLISAIIYNGCEFGIPPEENNTTGSVTLSGQVVESTTGNPVANAVLKIFSDTTIANINSDSKGDFSATFNLKNNIDIKVICSKTGYKTDTMNVYAALGSPISVPLIKLEVDSATGGNESVSGGAASIYLYSQSTESIGVKESGSIESAQIVFQVLDSSGIPITNENAVTLNFSFGSGPGGGEYLYPSSAKTNAFGRATVTLNTGTKAGVAQISADIIEGTQSIKSKPVLIAIHGGFPDKMHFELASDKLNYPAYGIVGYSIPFTAYVGDKYSNPVRPGTSVYFETTSGIIQGSSVTGDLGTATTTLLTQPFPKDATYGEGYFTVTASTVDENSLKISTTSIRLLSGTPLINVTPSTFNISNGGAQTFNYSVADVNGNPLSEGTSITVKVAEGNLKVEGDVSVTLPDTQSKTYTKFAFSAYDSMPDSVKPERGIIVIETTGPNGSKKISIAGDTN